MSRFNLILYVKLLGLAINLVTRILGYVTTIRDLLDDGDVNGSVEKPSWFADLLSVCSDVEALGSKLTVLRFDVRETEPVNVESE